MLTAKIKAKSLLSIALFASTVTLTWQTSAQAEENISELLVQTANMMNKNLPMMIDQNTQWDSSFAGPGKILSYNYTLVNYSATQIDGKQFARNIRQPLTNSICTNPTTQIFPENGVMLNFNYYDNTRNLIARVQVTPSDCDN